MTPSQGTPRVRVWDVPVRVFHWMLVVAFAGVFLTADTERLRAVHVQLGYTIIGLALFRIVWGFVGSRYARFSSFVAGPGAVWRYLRSVPTATPEHHVGHNPAGAAAMIGLLMLALTTGLSGYLGYEELAGEWVLELHEASAGAMLGLVGIHVAGVILASVRHRENLVAAMFTGWKHASGTSGIGRRYRLVGAGLILVVAGYWTVWGGAPMTNVSGGGRLAMLRQMAGGRPAVQMAEPLAVER